MKNVINRALALLMALMLLTGAAFAETAGT